MGLLELIEIYLGSDLDPLISPSIDSQDNKLCNVSQVLQNHVSIPTGL